MLLLPLDTTLMSYQESIAVAGICDGTLGGRVDSLLGGRKNVVW